MEYATSEPIKVMQEFTVEDVNVLQALANRVARVEKQNDILRASLVNLENKVEEYDKLILTINEGMENAKQNPMVRNLLKGLGL